VLLVVQRTPERLAVQGVRLDRGLSGEATWWDA